MFPSLNMFDTSKLVYTCVFNNNHLFMRKTH